MLLRGAYTCQSCGSVGRYPALGSPAWTGAASGQRGRAGGLGQGEELLLLEPDRGAQHSPARY